MIYGHSTGQARHKNFIFSSSSEVNCEVNQIPLLSIDAAAFLGLASDNDFKRTHWKIKFAPHQSQGKKEEQCQKEKERRRTDRRKKSSIKE